MSQHSFCRTLLRVVREEIREKRIQVPANITALPSTTAGRTQYFIEADGIEGVWIKADCSFEAKAKYLAMIIEKDKA